MLFSSDDADFSSQHREHLLHVQMHVKNLQSTAYRFNLCIP